MISVVHELDDTISSDALYYVNFSLFDGFASLFVLPQYTACTLQFTLWACSFGYAIELSDCC